MDFKKHEFKDNRGKHMTLLNQENIKRIHEWLRLNPDGTKKECAKALGLTEQTVCRLTKKV